jgi:hypothetical protein
VYRKHEFGKGKVIRHRVKWRIGGTGDWDGRQLDDYTGARRFQPLVTANGDHMPSLEQLIAYGFEAKCPRTGQRAQPGTTRTCTGP